MRALSPVPATGTRRCSSGRCCSGRTSGRPDRQNDVMADRPASAPPEPGSRATLTRVGVVVHPSRNVAEPIEAVTTWTRSHDAEVVQVPVFGQQQQQVAEEGAAADCDLIVAIGGDGTALAAIREAASAGLPVMGVACGSLGVLTTVPTEAVQGALERFAEGDWYAYALPGLQIDREGSQPLLAFNDVALVRAGQGQLRWRARVDGALFGRFAGDGCIVSTPMGTSGYSLAAGGPLLTPGTQGFVLTPVSVHGGSCPPLLIAAGSTLRLDLTIGYGGARFEIDGQIGADPDGAIDVTWKPEVAKVVRFSDQEPLLERLRKRQIVIDSPRILAEDSRDC
jgi:NAD+ kinase